MLDFATIAKEYCYLVNNTEQYTAFSFVSYIIKILPMLYLKALMLPDLKIEYDSDAVTKFVSEEEWIGVRLQIKQKLGEHDNYFELHGRFGQSEESSISENLADIYQDMKDFTELISFEIEESLAEAVSEVRKTFFEYWGQRAVNSLKILNAIYTQGSLSDEDNT